MQSARQIIVTVSLFVALTRAASGDEHLHRFSRSELHMGVEFEVVLYAKDAATGEAAIANALARVAELDKILSDYDSESELSKLSETSVVAKGSVGPFPIVQLSDDLWTVLAEARNVSDQTGGAFDVTIGPLTKLW